MDRQQTLRVSAGALGTANRQSGGSPMREFMAWERRAFREFLIEKYGPLCQLCILAGRGEKRATIVLDKPNTPRGWSIDHIVPISRGGKNELANMWPAHRSCNTSRGNAPIQKGKRNARV
jgi:5-methylcytosine-specific restriction endonuclease McrA